MPLTVTEHRAVEWDPLTMRFDPIRFLRVLEDQATSLREDSALIRQEGDIIGARLAKNRASTLDLVADAIRAAITEGHAPD